jgi:hypothetical protein
VARKRREDPDGYSVCCMKGIFRFWNNLDIDILASITAREALI